LRTEYEELKPARHRPFSILNSQFSIPTMSALLMALYLPFALYTQMLLSETLFITLLLAGFLALAIWAGQEPRTKNQEPRTQGGSVGHSFFGSCPLVAAGGLFGLATL